MGACELGVAFMLTHICFRFQLGVAFMLTHICFRFQLGVAFMLTHIRFQLSCSLVPSRVVILSAACMLDRTTL